MNMSRVAQSVYFFSFYLLLAGLALFVFPNTVLSLVKLPTTSEVWVHIVGALTFILGAFFFYMAKQNVEDFFFISMFGRGTFILALFALIIFWHAPGQLLLFATVDLMGLLWTLVTYTRKRA